MTSFVQRFQLLESWKTYFAILWPLLLLPIIIVGNSVTANCAYAVAILAGFWMTEAIPIPITSLMPMFLYPIMGIQSAGILASEYLKDSILIFVGGLLIALAFEYSGLHKRVALRVVLFTGTSIKMLMLGIMLCTMFLSMWMSNTAVSAMMVPIILAILEELENSLQVACKQEQEGCINESFAIEPDEKVSRNLEMQNVREETTSVVETIPGNKNDVEIGTAAGSETSKMSPKVVNEIISNLGEALVNRRVSEGQIKIATFMKNTRTMFLLSCCYASNIGGTGVITGSGTNLVAVEFLGNLDPKNHGDYASLTFTTWLAFNILPMLVNICVAWLYLQLSFLGIPDSLKFWRSSKSTNSGLVITPKIESKIKDMLQKTYDDLGDITAHEKGVGICFILAVISFIFHDPKFIPGWKDLFSLNISISTSALAISVLFFIIPRNEEFYTALSRREFTGVTFKPLLEWSFVQAKFPWGVVILLGGGYAMSNGAKKAGLSTWVGQCLKSLSILPPHGILAVLCVLVGFLTEIASNTATATIALPILLELSQELNIHPLYLTLPATVVCSYAFMLPVATPPNAIVYAASDMKVTDMIKAGFFMNCSCILVLYLSTITYGNMIFHFSEYNYVP